MTAIMALHNCIDLTLYKETWAKLLIEIEIWSLLLFFDFFFSGNNILACRPNPVSSGCSPHVADMQGFR